jgi:hypothetical protein
MEETVDFVGQMKYGDLSIFNNEELRDSHSFFNGTKEQ